MATFRYTGRDSNGKTVRGELTGNAADAVAAQLFANGVVPLDVQPVKVADHAFAELEKLLQRKPTLNELMLHARQMHALTKSGVPIVRGLTGLANSTRNPVLKNAQLEMVDSLQSGRSLAVSMAAHPKVFSPLFVNIVAAGEESGRLDEAYSRLFSYLQFEKSTLDRIKTALRYPSMVLVAVGIAVAVLMTMVIPQFARIFARFGADLPLATKIVVAASNFMVAHGGALLVGLIALVFGLRYWARTPRGRFLWARASFRIPIIGSILLRAALGRFARAFAMTYRAGVPLVQALGLMQQIVDNDYLAEAVKRIREGTERGESITQAATATQLFTPMVLQMMAVGEETGAIDDMMEEVADFYEREVAYDVDNLGALIEPILIMVVGGLVLVLALAVFMPIWDMSKVVTGKGS